MNSWIRMTALAFTFCLTLFTFSSAQAQDVSGVMMVVKGDIKITTKDGKTDAGKVGKKVTAGDTIQAGADSRAKIVMADKNVINVSPDSKIIIEKYENDGKDKKNVELNVVYGKVRASVEQKYDGEKNKFNVKTPSAVAGVRGTDFITSYSPSNRVSQVITFTGTVAFGQPGPGGSIQNPVFVQPGQTTSAGAGSAPEAPKAMPKEELNKVNGESKADSASNGKSETKGNSTEAKSNEDKAKDDKPKEKNAENSTEAKAEPAATDSRAPANSTVSMVDSADLGTAPTSAAAPTIASPVGLPTVGAHLMTPTQSTFISDAIQNNQKSKVQIILAPQ